MIYIRADMNNIIATGHVMRCLAIADAAKLRGEDTTFIMADANGEELITGKGYKCEVLDTDWQCMEEELPKLYELINKLSVSRLLVDSYQVTESYLQQLQKKVKVTYVDDLNMFRYPVDGLICYMNYWKNHSYEKRYNQEIKLYLGTEYAPLRQEFSSCSPKKIREGVERILLMSGGTDQYEIIPRLLKRLHKLDLNKIYVICGMYNINYESMLAEYEHDNRVEILSRVDNMKDYMDEADVVISAAGTTLYELCAVGTPTISYVLADNQIKGAAQFEQEGVIACGGDVRFDDVCSNVIDILSYRYMDERYRRDRSEKMQRMVDGKGAARLADILI